MAAVTHSQDRGQDLSPSRERSLQNPDTDSSAWTPEMFVGRKHLSPALQLSRDCHPSALVSGDFGPLKSLKSLGKIERVFISSGEG